MTRATLFAVTGVLWLVRSLVSFTDPAFTDPETAWDWFAVLTFSAALAALAIALPVFARFVGGRVVFAVALVPAVGAAIGALGNLVEDGMQQAWAGDWLYLPGVVLVPPGLAAFTVVVFVSQQGAKRTYAAVPALTLIGALLLERGGGAAVLIAWLGAAVLAWREDRATEAREPAVVAA